MKRITWGILPAAMLCLTSCGNQAAASQADESSGTRIVVAQQTDPPETASAANNTDDDFSIDLGTLVLDETGAAERAVPQHTTETKAVTVPPVTTVSAEPEDAVLSLVSFPAVVLRNEAVTLEVSGKPDTEYRIHVYYTSGESAAEGLEPHISDSKGHVSWSWQIGGKTRPGSFHIDITGGDELLRIPLTVGES